MTRSDFLVAVLALGVLGVVRATPQGAPDGRAVQSPASEGTAMTPLALPGAPLRTLVGSGSISEPTGELANGGAPTAPRRPVAATPLPARSVAVGASGAGGTAIYSASATWCAPTPTQCADWGGNARLAAVNSFRFGAVLMTETTDHE